MTDAKKRDAVLRRMLKTPPQPKKNGSAGKPLAKKLSVNEAEKIIRKAMAKKPR